jgi:uncharacterized OB-fold protein
MQAIETIAAAQDLFTFCGETPHLMGSRCDSCGACYFPKTTHCRNPACRHSNVVQTLLSPRGRLYSFTVQGYRPPALFRMEPWRPYAIGLVELPEGLRVMGMLTGCSPEEIRIGMAMQLVVRTLHRDELGRDVLTYMFEPVGVAESGQ